MTTRDTDWDGVRLHVVTGKGGTGKTTVAAALALALARAGRRVLLIEVEGRQGIARLFDCPPLPYEERKVALGLGAQGAEGGDVYALAVDPEGALLDYLEMFYNMRRAGQHADQDGRGRLRDHDRARPVRRAGHREGHRGGPAAGRRPEQRPPVSRGRDGRPADRPDRPVPRREHGGLRPGQGGSDQDARGHRGQGDPLAADRGALRHHAGGDAGPGDPGRRRGAAGTDRRRHPARRHHHQHGPPGHARRRRTWPRRPADPWTSPSSSSG